MVSTDELLTRGVENIIPSKEKLKKLLDSGKKLNVYLGIDPTATRIHLGHAVPLRKLQAFASRNHNVTFLIGDFTALIGDTSDKDSERPVLTSDEIKKNFETYKKQAEKILNFSRVSVKFNSEWLKKLNFEDIVKLTQHFSFGDFASRELVKKRLAAGKKVGLHEALYPVMQGYDSYFLDTDIQLGGTDQTFNMQAGRVLQKDLRNKESYIIANGFLTGLDGRKMSKSWGNAVWLDDAPIEMFGKIMSLKDDLIEEYFRLATNLPVQEVRADNPMIRKLKLAHQIVMELHSLSDADNAKDHFTKTFQDRKPDFSKSVSIEIGSKLVDVISKALDISNSESKRLISQGAVDIDEKTIKDTKYELKGGEKIKIGKKNFFKTTKK